jgi:hypothetical protein
MILIKTNHHYLRWNRHIVLQLLLCFQWILIILLHSLPICMLHMLYHCFQPMLTSDYGSRNQEGERILNFVLAYDLFVTNTLFRKRVSPSNF